jgi:hypothetical protein
MFLKFAAAVPGIGRYPSFKSKIPWVGNTLPAVIVTGL